LEIFGIEGTNLDARLKHNMLTDPVLQVDLSGDEFRAFINLTVWTVSLVSDGEFQERYALIVPGMSKEVFHRLVDLQVVIPDGSDYRINPMYWKWQSSRAELEKLAARREQARVRQADKRTRDSLRVIQ